MTLIEDCDVTEYFHLYRLALRAVWSTAIWNPERSTDESWVLDSFRKIKAPLFEALVLDKLDWDGAGCCERDYSAVRFYLVPRLLGSTSTSQPIPVQISSNRDGRGFDLDHPFNKAVADDIVLRYLDVMDQIEMTWMDLRYFQFEVESCKSDPSIAGLRGIIDVTRCAVVARIVPAAESGTKQGTGANGGNG